MSRRKSNKNGACRSVAKSFQEYGRGVAGGLMFSLPLLYTMEVWWAGFNSHPWRLAAYVLATFVLLLGYNRYAGLHHDASMAEVAIDSVEELGIGLIISAVALLFLGRISFEMPASEAVGQIVVEAMTVAIGVSVGTAQLGGTGDASGASLGDAAGGAAKHATRGSGKAKKKDDARGGQATEGQRQGEPHFGGQMLLALCGATLFASNVAPTEEIVVIAVESSWVRLLALAFVSIVLGSLILHYSEFRGAQQFVRKDGLSTIVLGSVITYAVALFASALILWFFGRFDGVSLYTALAQILVLAVAATLGASAGRLLLQQ
ncbi:MAG TPA: TIGR02587 family membrane protein [Pyrinomonadaceae bacterium]|jgi:putative integral membrane protein (TIGR02587 family)|nr:TIGR02587 family membrane protein [Pyrinomonadaceae bacterium]